MFEKLISLIHDRKRSVEEHQIVKDVLYRANAFTCGHAYAVYPWINHKRNYEELKKLPTIISELQDENCKLEKELAKYKEHVESVDSVINTMLETIEQRYTKHVIGDLGKITINTEVMKEVNE